MASAQFLEEALSSDADEKAMSAIVGSLETQHATPKVTTVSPSTSLGLSNTFVSSPIPVNQQNPPHLNNITNSTATIITNDLVTSNHLNPSLNDNKNSSNSTPINTCPNINKIIHNNINIKVEGGFGSSAPGILLPPSTVGVGGTAGNPINGIPLAVTANIEFTKVPPQSRLSTNVPTTATSSSDAPAATPAPSLSMTVHLFNNNAHSGGGSGSSGGTTTRMPAKSAVLPSLPGPIMSTNTQIPVSGVSGTTLGGNPGQPTYINASSGFQILNMNAIRTNMQGVSVGGSGTPGNIQAIPANQGSAKTLAPRMILGPQVIGARPGQPGVHDCSSEFITKSNNDNLKESSDSKFDVFDTKQYDDNIPTPRIEDNEETVLSHPVPLLRANSNPSPAQGEDSEVLCLAEVKHQFFQPKTQSSVHPYQQENSLEIEPEPTEFFSCSPNPISMTSQARFSSTNNSQCGSPILNLDEHSHSDIIRFNSTENSTAMGCVQTETINKSADSQSVLEVPPSDSSSSDPLSLRGESNQNHFSFQNISDVQIRVGLEPVPSIPQPTTSSHTETTTTMEQVNDESGGLRLQTTNQSQTRQSILVPNTITIVAQHKILPINPLVQEHIPASTSAQSNQWTRSSGNMNVNASQSTDSVNNHTKSLLTEPCTLPETQANIQTNAQYNTWAESEFSHLISPTHYPQSSSDSQYHVRPTQITTTTHRHLTGPQSSTNIQPHQTGPQISPNSRSHLTGPEYTPTSQPHSYASALQFSSVYQPRPDAPQYSPTSHSGPHRPQFSSNIYSQQHAQHISPTSQTRPQVPQFSPTSQPHLRAPYVSPTSQPHSHAPLTSPTSQPHSHAQLTSPNSQPHLAALYVSPTSQSHSQGPLTSPTSQLHPHAPLILSTSQPHSYGSHVSPIPQPHLLAPHVSPTAQPHSQTPHISPTNQSLSQVPHFSANLHQNSHRHQSTPQFSPISKQYPNAPQFSPPSQTRQVLLHTSQAIQRNPLGKPYLNGPQYPPNSQSQLSSHLFSTSSSSYPIRPTDSPTSQPQTYGVIPHPSSHPLSLPPQPHQHSFNFSSASQPPLISPRQFSPTKTSHQLGSELSGDHHPGSTSAQYKITSGVTEGPPKCFTTDAQLQSQYLHYNQTHPLTVQVKKSLPVSPSSPPGQTYAVAAQVKSGNSYSSGQSLMRSRPSFGHPSFPVIPRSDPPMHSQQSYPSAGGHSLAVAARSQPNTPHPYDLQARHTRPNLQNSPTNVAPGPYNSQSSPRWVSHYLVRNLAAGPTRGMSSQDSSSGHGHGQAQENIYSPEHSPRPVNPNYSGCMNTAQSVSVPHGRSSDSQSQGQLCVRHPSDRLVQSSFSQGNVHHSIGGGRGTFRPIAHQSSTHAQYSSQNNHYHSQSDSSSNVYYQGQDQSNVVPSNSLPQVGVTSSSGNYPVICRVSPIRNRLESNIKSTAFTSNTPYKFSPGPAPPSSQEYSVDQRTHGMEYNLYQHDQYNERMRRLCTQFTLQALPGLPPGAQGGHHLLVKTESGQFQLLRFGMPAPALTAATGTPLPHPPSSQITLPNSVSHSSSSPSVVTTTTNSNAQLPPNPSTTPNTFAGTTSNSVTTTTILGGVAQSQVVVTQAPIPGPLSANINYMSTSSPRPAVVVSSSTISNSSNTTISNSSIPSQISTGSPALATTTTTYRLQNVPPVPPTAASNSSGVGMTASMSMQQQMHLPQVLPHSQVPPSQTPSSVLTSANASTTSTTATTVSQMTPETAKTKCKNFLSFLLELSAKQNQTVARNVKTLIQGLVDGKVNAEDFSDRLQKEVNSQPQPCLVGFLKKSLPPLRHSLATKELTIEGIRAPVLTALPSGVPTTPVTALIPQNQVRPPSVPTTPVRIITPINSSPSPQPANSGSAPIPRTTATAVQQRFAAPSKNSPSSKASKASTSNSSSPSTQTHPSTSKAGPSSKSTGKEKGDKKAFASNAGYSGDDDINDVAAMGGVNLAEESQRILGSTELIGTQIRSCKDEASLPAVPLQSKIKAIAAKHGLEEPSPEVAAMISHAIEERLKTLLEKLSVIAEHRLDVIKLEDRYDVSQDVKGQLRFLEELDKLERKRHDEQEREMLIRAAKSRSKSEDPEQAKLKAKAKEMQRVALEEMRQREANTTALLAIGPRKKPKLDTASGSQSTTSQTPQSSLGASSNLNRPQMAMRPRLKRVSLRDLLFLLEQEKETTRSHFLYKHLLLK